MMVPDWAGYREFRPAFMQVVDERYWPIEWLDRCILEGQAHFFRSKNAAIIVELRRFPGGAMDIHGLIAAGDKDEIVNELIPEAETWGRSQGCTAAVIESREGWKRELKSSGYEVHQVALRKEF